jgi:cation transport ATPase
MFDKTGTLTVGGVRLVAIETSPGEDPDKALRFAASLEQASHHLVAAAIVSAAQAKGLALQIPENVHEAMGPGLEGVVGGRNVCVGSHQLVYGRGRPEDWALRALRRASWHSALSVVVRLADRIAEAGMTVYLPRLFGEPGRLFSTWYQLQSSASVIISHFRDAP